ncbi:hypothetical protein [Nocardioides speluncae]|uniref:hypothetical protein n=1 Tax=Nocardioides speluncae TaxID=2670337 RepID=UPI0012B16CDF|nr:hypothetical protein [Nocardioides speluncae]
MHLNLNPKRHLVLTALVAAMLAAAGCGGETTAAEDPAERPATGASQPTLLVRTSEPEGAMQFDALSGGTLGVNAHDCFTVSGNPLSVPAGSKVWPDGRGITIPELGRFAIGDKIRGGGGNFDLGPGGIKMSEQVRACTGGAQKAVLVRIN